ncbi:MAG: rhodanese-like domain-containing protein [Bacteroidia bacterium]|jgi:rhodanese-related sulfurtransferase|nr:rhodanese-like domain-containing protein [Sphingobacteriaceae bacterium]MBK7312218.1 rhodanese-like domain-containing protein [Sphingobacteriaceae bacterium]MBK7816935.1 rhodanese-like domain-containing protein [Sphingobacteriaceae bacterium]MBP9069335.1 rhodanese-like domain-containing protein [Bacteroidia bacterium]
MKKLIILLSFIFSMGVSAQNARDVDAETFKKLMKDKKSIVIDLRTPEEIKTKGKIKNALEIDFLAMDAEDKIKKLDKKKTYLIYCAGGGRSGDCKDLMVKEGFNSVINLAKGFDDWKKKGFEAETVK